MLIKSDDPTREENEIKGIYNAPHGVIFGQYLSVSTVYLSQFYILYPVNIDVSFLRETDNKKETSLLLFSIAKLLCNSEENNVHCYAQGE